MIDFENGLMVMRTGEPKDIIFTQFRVGSLLVELSEKSSCYCPIRESLYKTATSPLKRKNIDETLINQICFNPRLAFKFHSRLIAIIFCAFIAIWTTVAFFVAVLGPGIDYLAQVAVYYWQVYAPAIGVFDIIIRGVSV